MSKVFRRSNFVTKTICAISAAAVVTGGIAFYLSKDTRVLASAVDEGKAVPVNLDAVSAINYATILGRATDFGIVANDFDQVTHMETTFAVNRYSNSGDQVNEVDFIGNTAQFMIGEINTTQPTRIKFGQRQTASSYVIEATDAVFTNFDTEWQSGEIFQDADVNSSYFYFDNAGRIWNGDNATPVYTVVKSQDDITTNINDIIGNTTVTSNYISSRATDPAYALDYTQYLTIDNLSRDPYNPQDERTGRLDQGNRYYIDIDKSEFVNRVVYINVDQNLARVMANSEGLCIIKDPSTVVVFNIEPGVTNGDNGGLTLNRICVSEDGGRNFCNSVTSSQGQSDVSNSKSSNLGTVNDIDFYNADVDRMINQKIILNIRSTFSNIELNAVGGTVLIPDPRATANVRGSSTGWVVSGGHLRNEGGEWHYIYQGGSQDLINITSGQQIHFALHKDFTTDNGTTVDNSVYMAPGQFEFNLYDLGSNVDYSSINRDSINGKTPVTASNQATGNVLFPTITLNDPGDYYYVVTESNPGHSDGEITNTSGYIKIHVHVEEDPNSPADKYVFDYAYYLNAEDTTPVRHEEGVVMMGVQFDLGKFYNKVEATGTLTLNKTVLGVPASEAHETYTMYVKSGNTFYGMDDYGNLRVSSTPIACEVHPGVPFVLRDLPLDQVYTVSEERNNITIRHYECRVSGEGTVALSTNGTHDGRINITNTYSGKFEMGALHIAKFGSDTNGALLSGARFSLTTSADTHSVSVTGATNVELYGGTVNFTTVSTSDVYIEGLAEGTYTLTEITAPDNYEAAEPVQFVVDGFGQISYTGSAQNVSYSSTSNVLSITDAKDEPTPVTATVDFSKQDIAGDELPGAYITVTSNNGHDLSTCTVNGGGSNIVTSTDAISFVSGSTPTTISGLPAGEYLMHEIAAPSGYQVATDIIFTVDENGNVTGTGVTAATANSNAVVTMQDAPTVVNISKKDTSAGDELPGAILILRCTDTATDLSNVTVSGGGTLQSKTSFNVIFESGDTPAVITGLPDGTYILHEEVAPVINGVEYDLATDIEFTISNGKVIAGDNVTVATDTTDAVVSMYDDILVIPTGTVDLSKQDTVGGAELPGARITVISEDGHDLMGCSITGGAERINIYNNTISYTSGNTPTTISGLPAGRYTMHEEAAPSGYLTATDIEFTVGDDGTVTGSSVRAATDDSNALITMLDAPIVVDISKQDIAGAELPGAQITITSEDGFDLRGCTVTGGAQGININGSVISYTSGTSATTISGLPAGRYTMHEVTAPDGYQVATDIVFTVAADGTVTGTGVTAATATNNAVVTMQDAPTVVDISKKDTVAGEELPGATITVTGPTGSDLTSCVVTGGASDITKSGNTITFTSGTRPTTITGLPAGDYTMHEVTAPTGYQVATDISFTVDQNGAITGSEVTSATTTSNASITMLDAPAVVDISKVAVGGGDELPGAQMELTCSGVDLTAVEVSGGAQDVVKTASKITFTSGTSAATFRYLPDGTYTLHEEVAPVVNGVAYDLATDITFTVTNGVVSGTNVTAATTSTNARVTMEDDLLVIPVVTGTVDISKVAVGGGNELPGAQITITGPEGSDLTNCTVTGGAQNVNRNNNVISFTSGTSAATISGLPAGTYTMHEVTPPTGYQVATDIIFTVAADGTITGSEVTDATATDNAVVTMQDAPTVVDISKKDTVAGEELPGATITVTGPAGSDLTSCVVTGGASNITKSGNTITFTSGTRPTTITGLPAGDYTMDEVTAPTGYQVATTINFTVDQNGAITGSDVTSATTTSNARVTMFDAPAVVDISKVAVGGGDELPGAQMELTCSGVDLTAVEVSGGAQDVVKTASKITFTSGTSSATFRYLPDGTYTLHEEVAPVVNGVAYDLATDIVFTVENGVVSGDAHVTAATTSSNAKVTMEDELLVTPVVTGTVDISKKDTVAGEELPGAQITITGPEGSDLTSCTVTGGAQNVNRNNNVISFTSGTRPTTISGLPAGEYTMHEVTAPTGYQVATDIIFTVGADGTITGSEVTDSTANNNATVTMLDAPAVVDISKVAVGGGSELPGAQMELTCSGVDLTAVEVSGGAQDVVKTASKITFTSGTSAATFRYLPDGTYTLHEEVAPVVNGVAYDLATDIVFTVENGVVSGDAHVTAATTSSNAKVTMEDELLVTPVVTGTVDISKKDTVAGEELPGAQITITAIDGSDLTNCTVTGGGSNITKSGNTITFTSGTRPTTISGLPAGDYTMEEVTAPTGYQVATTINFTVDQNGNISGSEVTDATANNNATVTMLDAPAVVDISKVAVGGGDELPGAHMELTCSGVDLTAVEVSGGAQDVVKTASKITFTSGTSAATFTYLPDGTYTLHEEVAPVVNGVAYDLATDIVFTVENGVVSGDAHVTAATTSSNARVTMEDDLLITPVVTGTVDISKKDTVAGEELPGAQITITAIDGSDLTNCTVTGGGSNITKSGNTITFTSGTRPTTISGLPAGEYTMQEVTAPTGYQVATTINFTVDQNGNISGSEVTDATANNNATVTMLDAPAVVDISKVAVGGGDELPGAHMELTCSGVDLTAVEVSGGAQDVVKTSSKITFTSGTSAATFRYLPDGTYTLHEEVAPVVNGVAYDLATDIVFTVENGVVSGDAHVTAATISSNAKVTMEDDILVTSSGATVDISKVAVGGGDELPGAQLELTCADDRVDLTQITVSGGAQDVVKTASKISFKSGDSISTFAGLPDGTYTLHEEVAPVVNGVQYDVATDIVFTVENGVVRGDSHVTAATSSTNAIVTMEDAVLPTPPSTTTVSISKQNVAGEELPGAQLVLTGPATANLENCAVTGGGTAVTASGNTISFTSGSSATTISDLPNGDYVLVETVAPNINGVQYIETTISFTVTDGVVTSTSTDARVSSNGTNPVVVMIDDAVVPSAGCTLILNKEVASNGANVPSSYTFYVKSGDVYYGFDDQGNVVSDANPIAVNVVPGTSAQLTGLPSGDYTVTEERSGIEVAGYTLSVTGETTVTLNDADPSTSTGSVSIVNTYNPMPGSLTIVKQLGDGAPASAASMTYSFTVTGPNGYSNTVSVVGAGSVTIDNLQPGSYVVTENTTDAYINGYQLTAEGNGVTVAVTAGNNSNVTVTNNYAETTVATQETTEATTTPSAEATVATTTTSAEATVATTTTPTTTSTEVTTTTTVTVETTEQNSASVLGAARETSDETTASETTAAATPTPTPVPSGTAARTGESRISATAVIAVVLMAAGTTVLVARKKICSGKF